MCPEHPLDGIDSNLKTAGSRWMLAVQDRSSWHSLGNDVNVNVNVAFFGEGQCPSVDFFRLVKMMMMINSAC